MSVNAKGRAGQLAARRMRKICRKKAGSEFRATGRAVNLPLKAAYGRPSVATVAPEKSLVSLLSADSFSIRYIGY